MATMTDTTVIAPDTARASTSYVDWPAVFAGLILASGISLVLLAFGAALGLSFADLDGREGASPLWIGIGAAIWLVWVQVSSFMAGGYVTGRMRQRVYDATEHEVDVRDGIHGLLVWAGALVVGAIIATGGIGAVAGAVGGAAQTATLAASNATEGQVSVNPADYFSDTMLRGDRRTSPDARAEVSRILISAGDEAVPQTDREYLNALVARETGLTQQEADARVTAVLNDVEAVRTEAAEAAEAARKAGIVGAFLTAAALLISAAGAYWAASIGGRHRDEGTVLATFFRRY